MEIVLSFFTKNKDKAYLLKLICVRLFSRIRI